MTPAIKLLEKQKVEFQVHRYQHERDAGAYGLEAADKLGVDASRVFKTLVVDLDGKKLATVIVPVAHQVSLKAAATALKAKRAQMAEPINVERTTGYVLGGVSPLGQKKRLATVLDESARNCKTIYVSAGKRGLEIELAPDSLIALLGGHYAKVASPITSPSNETK